jgi:hypothetical protein
MSIFKPRTWGVLFFIYVIVGLVIAWQHSYVNATLLRLILSALLAIFLWPLILLGVGLHLH